MLSYEKKSFGIGSVVAENEQKTCESLKSSHKVIFGAREPPGRWGPAGGGSDSGLSHVFCSFSATTEPIPKLFFSYESIFVEDFDSLGGHTKFFASEAPREA